LPDFNGVNLYSSIDDFPARPTVLTIGTFDGVHLGHRKIIDRVVQSALELDCQSLVLTFFPHPRMVLDQDGGVKLLNTLEEKRQLLESTGLQNLIVHPFDQDFANLPAETFVREILVKKLNLRRIIIGHDHRFGKNRDAGIDDLIRFGAQFGFEVEQIGAATIDHISISSTQIRKALAAGDMERANAFLGYDYFITGTVVEGKKLGRTIGYPTANLSIGFPYKLIPKIGIYVIRCEIDGRNLGGMLSIGLNPTVGGDSLSVEAYFFDFGGDLYHRRLQVTLLHYLRDEAKFGSMAEMQAQIDRDARQSRAFLSL
jgi:riboflavin kinase/FMN adenylyltransferase